MNALGGESMAFMIALVSNCFANINEFICRACLWEERVFHKYELKCQSPLIGVTSPKGLSFQKAPELRDKFGTRSTAPLYAGSKYVCSVVLEDWAWSSVGHPENRESHPKWPPWTITAQFSSSWWECCGGQRGEGVAVSWVLHLH